MLQRISLFLVDLFRRIRNTTTKLLCGVSKTRDHSFDAEANENGEGVDNHRNKTPTSLPHHTLAFHNIRIEEF